MATRSYMGVVPVSFILLIVWTSVTWSEHHFFERPVQYALITLSVAAAALLGLSKTALPLKVGRGSEKSHLKRGDDGYSALRGTDRSDDIELLSSHRRTASSQSDAPLVDGLRKQRIVLAALAVSIALRVALSRKITEAPQCAVHNFKRLSLPIILALYDYTQGHAYKKTAEDEHDSISNTAFEDFWDFFRWTNIRYLPLSMVLSWGVYLLAPPGHTSTAMCAGTTQGTIVFLLQLLELCLDITIILLTWRSLSSVQDDPSRIDLIGRISFSSVFVLCIGSIIALLFNLGSVADILTTSSSFRIGACQDGLMLAAFLFCLSYIIKDLRPFAMVYVVTFMATVIPLFLRVWEEKKPFPPQNHGWKIFGLILTSFIFLAFIVVYRASELKEAPNNILKRIHFLWYIVLIGSMTYGVVAIATRRNIVGFHPIKLMIYKANDESTKWSKHALQSSSLDVAVQEYATRYHRLPPPYFDKWHEFAQRSACVVIDNYDQINDDLLPFWGVEPEILRRYSVPKTNMFSAIRINMDGPGVSGDDSNQPMLDMIRKFAEFLPPMQIVVHRSPEPQVSIPYATRLEWETVAINNMKQPRTIANGNWTQTEDWPAVPAAKDLPPPSISALHLSRWDAYVQPACPPSSPAQRHPWFSDNLCVRCAIPHSINQFIWNVTKSLDLCHQPDLSTISNFLSSPATAPLTGHDASYLLPIFSPRKATGYNDILYPAPGSYVQRNDSAGPPELDFRLPPQNKFHDRRNSLFWLGKRPLTSGLPTNSWQGLAEQRLVQLANKPAKKEKVVFLLPLDEHEKTYMNGYVKLAGVAPQLRVKANFTVSEPADKCQKPAECRLQDKVLNVPTFDQPHEEFEESRYNHRYSLSMDTDPPHKFVQDLQSNSAAVRATIFREWWEERLTPWQHYIPLDMRWHGLHSTLAYFMGVEGIVKGKEVKMKRREKEGAWIATEGKKRAAAVMREADAEVYLFRLLLEWGRIVDDNREELGFTT